MIKNEATSAYCLETVKKRIKFLEAKDPNNVVLKLLKRQISINVSEEVKG